MCTPTRRSFDVGDRVFWRRGETLPPVVSGRRYHYLIEYGRVLSIGQRKALVTWGMRSQRFVAVRLLCATHKEAEAMEFAEGSCPLCGAVLDDTICTERCWEDRL